MAWGWRRGYCVGTLTWPVTHQSSILCGHRDLSLLHREDQHQCLDTTLELRSMSSSERWEEDDKDSHGSSTPSESCSSKYAPNKSHTPPPHPPHPVLHPPAVLCDLISLNLLCVSALHEAERKSPVWQLGWILHSKWVNMHAQRHSKAEANRGTRKWLQLQRKRYNFRSKLWNTVSVINGLSHTIASNPTWTCLYAVLIASFSVR